MAKLLDLEGLKTLYNKIDSEKQATMFEDKAGLYDALTIEGALEEVMSKANDLNDNLSKKVTSEGGTAGPLKFSYGHGHGLHCLDLYVPETGQYGGHGTYRLWDNKLAATLMDYYTTEGKTFENKPFVENLYLPDRNKSLNGDIGYLTAQQLVDTVANKADYEYGRISNDNNMWYTTPEEGYVMTGDYRKIGSTCILDVTVNIRNEWLEAYYTLPMAATEFASLYTIANTNNQTLIVTTDTRDNLSVLKIFRADGAAFSEGKASFQFIYQCE